MKLSIQVGDKVDWQERDDTGVLTRTRGTVTAIRDDGFSQVRLAKTAGRPSPIDVGVVLVRTNRLRKRE